MFTITPQLLLQENPLRFDTCDGWYLPGDQPARWGEMLLGLPGNLNAAKLLAIPTSVQERSPRGLVCLLPSAAEIHSSNAVNSAIALRKITNGTVEVWTPWNGEIFPDQTLDQLLPGESDSLCYVWLPSCGLVRFDQTDQLQLSDLFRSPQKTTQRSWKTPPLVATLPRRIVDIEIVATPMQSMFAQEQKDIGGDPTSLMELNDDGTINPSGVTQKVSNWLRRKIREAHSKRANQSGNPHQPDSNAGWRKGPNSPSSRPGMLTRLLAKNILSQRENQIDKLLDLMHRDPDRALQFAIPMRDSMFRGIAESGAKLIRQATDFSLSGLFGGSEPADSWDLRDSVRERLRNAYMEQARREIALGRFRRAAYIHAHLLGDFSAAADLLERGGHFSEAAVLFGDHLNQPTDQARCLENAGQFSRAAELYESLDRYDDAARIWGRLGEDEKAQQVYETAVAKKISERQIIAAATILIDSLNDAQRAEQLLWSQWPGGAEPLACASMAFQRCAESGRHEFAMDRFGELADSPHHDLQLAKLACELSKTYPYQPLRDFAEDTCRVSATRKIDKLSHREMDSRLGVLQSLNADDTVLQRDLRRFRSLQHAQQPKLQPQQKVSARVTELETQSPYRIAWKGRVVLAKPVGRELLVICQNQNKIELIRVSELPIGLQRVDVERVVLTDEAESYEVEEISVCFRIDHGEILIEVILPSQRPFQKRFRIGPVGKAEENWNIKCTSLGERAVYDSNGSKWSMTLDHKLLREYRDNRLTRTIDMDAIVVSSAEHWRNLYMHVDVDHPARVMLSATRDLPVIAYDRMVLALWNGQMIDACLLKASPLFIANSIPHTKSRILIGTQQSLELLTWDTHISVDALCSQDAYQHGCFLFGGKIAATTGSKLRVFGRVKSSIRLIHENQLPASKVICVFPIGTDLVGVVQEDGLLQRFAI